MRILVCAAAFLALSTMAASAAEPVVASSADKQMEMLKSGSPQEVANKKLVYDMWREFLIARHIDAADKFLAPEYHQHNPNAETGLEGVKAYFRAQNVKPGDIPPTIPNLVEIAADRDIVFLSFVRELKDKDGNPYTTTWFDSFRVKDGKIVEHWDAAMKP